VKVTLRVHRQDHAGAPARLAVYEVEAGPTDSVWDCLDRIARTTDPTLALRDNCFAAVCGECGVRVNQREVLGCTARIRDLGNDLTVEPLRQHRIERDLIVDRASHFDRLAAAEASFVPGPPQPRIDDARMTTARAVTACTQCGLCVSACQSYERGDAAFAGPAALAWTYRFLDDPRDGAHEQRRAVLGSPHGTAGCIDCGACDPVCPEHVAPLRWIHAARAASSIRQGT
jgi:succinate dehydrogenase / fumarate reductase iron-sulfur subunit